MREYVAQFEYAVAQSTLEQKSDSIQSVRVVVPYVKQAKDWLKEARFFVVGREADSFSIQYEADSIGCVCHGLSAG